MTHDQIDRMVRKANPLPDPGILGAVDAPVLTTERRTEMQTDDRVVIEGGGPSGRRGMLVGIATAAVILVAGLVFFLTMDETPVATPAPNATPLDTFEFGEPLAPGAYIANPDDDETSSIRGTFVLEGTNWNALTPEATEINDSVSLMIVEVDEVYTTACNSGEGPVAAESTTEGLANQFASNGFTIREALIPVNAFGYDGHKLVMEVPAGCDDAADQVWNGSSFQGRYYQGSGQVLEYWFLDVEGTPIMVEATWFPDTPAEEVAELRAVLDTLVITP